MRTTLESLRCLAIAAILICSTRVGSAQQNTLSTSVNTGPVFLYGTISVTPAPLPVTITSSPNANVSISIATNVPWLSVATPSAGTTPAAVQFIANPNDKSITGPGVYQGIATITSPSASTLQVFFIFTVNNATPLTATPPNLIFQYTAGGALPAAQQVSITAGVVIPYSVGVSAPWLVLGAGTNSGQTPGQVTVDVAPSSLTPGAYVASVTITPTNGLPGIIVPVLFFYNPSPQLTLSPTSLTFNYQVGGAANILQKNISLTSGTGAPALNFSASASTATGGQQWLSVAPTTGTTPGTLTATVNPAGLPAGQYQGTITVMAPGASTPTMSIPVTLNVSTAPLLDLNATSLSFTYQVGGSLPADQFIIPNSTTPGMNYTVAVSTNNTGSWLNVTASGITPTPVDVNVNPVGLPNGTYNGTITFNAINGGNNPQVVNVTLTVSTVPTLTASPGSVTFNYELGFNVPGAQTISVTGNGGSLAFSVTANQTNTSNNVTWLLVGTPSSATTPGTFTVAVSPAGMAAGQYTGTITVTTSGNATPLSVPVTLNVANMGNPLASVNPTSLTFNAQVGGTANPQTVTVSSTGEPINYAVTASVTTPQNSGWLAVGPPAGPASAATPSNFFVGINPANLAIGSYKGTITVDPKNGNPVVTIPVTVNITLGNLVVSSTTLNFTQNAGGAAPQPQTVNIGSSGAALQFTAFPAGASWLTVSPTSATTPAQLSVSVNGTSLQPGSYSGQINIVSTGAGNSPQTITVNLTVAQAQAIVLNPTSLTFTSQFGSPAPPAQTVALSASSGAFPFTAAASVTGPAGGSWLSVAPASGTNGGGVTNLFVSVNPQGLAVGTYNGAITVTSPNASNSPQTIPVTYTVNRIPTPTPTNIENSASYQPGPVAPGELIGIYGTNLGPTPGVAGAPDSTGKYPVTLGGVQVTFDNIPAPLYYVSATQINLGVPYELAGRAQTQLVITYQNTPSTAVVLNVASSAPGIFIANAAGQGAIFNQDFSPNGVSNPAPRGTAIVIYATGEGQTSPAGVDGLVIALDVNALKKPVLPVSVTVGGQQAQILYAGSAPTLVSGMLQINAVVPSTAPTGGAIPVVVTVGGNSSTGVATMAVQ